MGVRQSPILKRSKFIIGGMSAMGATLIVHPLDLIKNRMQISVFNAIADPYQTRWDHRRQCGEGVYQKKHTTSRQAIKIVRREGILALYNGISAGLLRQGTYGSTRLGLYSTLMEMTTGADGTPPSFILKIFIGIFAGGISSLMWTPTDVCLVRMLADGSLPASQRRGYTNVFNALYRICSEEGILTLWRVCFLWWFMATHLYNGKRGCIPTVSRAMIVNASELATYTQSKQLLLSSGYFHDNIVCHFGASMVTGVMTVLASTPMDMAKTRIQNMEVIDGKPKYTGFLDVFGQTIRNEGFFSLWKGLTPYYVRIGPYTVFLFVFMEQLNKLYRKHF